MSAQARNIIMGMERCGQIHENQEVNLISSVNVCEGEGGDKQNFYIPGLHNLLDGSLWQEIPEKTSVWRVGWRVSDIIRIYGSDYQTSGCDGSFWLAKIFEISFSFLNPHNSKYIINIIIYICNYYSREYRLMSSSSLECKWVIFLYKSR